MWNYAEKVPSINTWILCKSLNLRGEEKILIGNA